MTDVKTHRNHIAAVALVVAGAIGGWHLSPSFRVEAAPAVDDGLQPAAIPASFADIIEAVQPTVVNISASGPAPSRRIVPGPGRPGPGGDDFEDFFRRFFGRQSHTPTQGHEAEVRSMGTGFIIDPDGLVVTNNHVIDGAEDVTVTLNDGTKYTAMLVGRDAKTDLALLEVEADTPLPYASFGDSDATRTGDWVVAIGNPFGLGGTATTGIVSARGRDIRSGPFDDFLQIDAPINQGNSGGPLFDTTGTVVGVNTAIYSPNGGNVGIGFAIPAAQAAPIIDQLRSRGHVERGWLGVEIQTVEDDIAAGLGMDEATGALVADVVEDSPADDAGLEPGDVITAFDGEPVEDIRDLTRLVAAAGPEKDIELEVWSDGDTSTYAVDLGTSPDDMTQAANRQLDGTDESEGGLGLSLAPLTAENRQRYDVGSEVEGALVMAVAPDSLAATQGLRPGDVVVRVGRTPVSSPDEVADTVAAIREEGRPSVILQIVRDAGRRFLAVPLA